MYHQYVRFEDTQNSWYWVILSHCSFCFLGHTGHVEASFDKYEILFQIKWVGVACSLHDPQDVGCV